MRFLLILTISIILFGCKKPPIEPIVLSNFTNGFFALNEGLFQQNNASLSFFSNEKQTVSSSIFSSINGRGLGDTANDMISFIYEGKLYYAIAINVSSQIEILDGLTLESIAQIGLFDNSIGRQPRTLKFYEGFIYSINFDGTVSTISMKTLDVTSNIEVGQNPESSLIYQNKLYVVNTGGLNFPNYDSTISVIDLESNSVISTFVADINGSSLLVDFEGDGYLISRGDYGNIKHKLLRLDLNTFSVKNVYPINTITMTYSNRSIYYYSDVEDAIFEFDTENETAKQSPLIDCSDFENVAKIVVNENQQLLYIIDVNGYVNSSIIRIYDLKGNFQREITAGLNTNSLLFVP
ncbi:MAG: YncE family protein [Crocinitomicaceae bacterium]